jgi:predicted TIM-barrel fold metal-dependent hydrolase
MHLGQLYTLLRERPNTRWILAHAGGGLPFYALMKKEVEEVLSGCLFDIAALPFLFKPEGLLAMARAAGPEKFVLGTDFPLLPPKRYYRLLEDSGLSQEEQAMILGGNMERELW